jgi:potassium efflux system protein
MLEQILIISRRLLGMIALAAILAVMSFAAEPIDAAQLALRAETWKLQIDKIEAAAGAADIDDAGLAKQRHELEVLQVTIDDAIAEQQPVLAGLKERLVKLGPEPEPGAPPESDLVASERKALNEQISQLEGTLKVIGLEIDRMTEIIQHISERRRANFANALLTRTSSPISLELWSNVLNSIRSEYSAVAGLIHNWFRFVALQHPLRTAMAILLSAVVALAMFLADRKVIAATFSRDFDFKAPSALRISLSALWMAVAPTFAMMVGAWLIYVVFDQFALLRPPIDHLFAATLAAVTGFFGAQNLSRAVLAPRRPAWRIFAIDDGAARRLRRLSLVIAAVYAVNYVLAQLNIILSANLSLTVARSAVSAILIGVILMAVVRTQLRASDDGAAARRRGWPSLLYFALWGAAAALLASTMLGYIGLGGFLSTQVVITGAILLVAYMGYLVAKALATPEVVTNSFFGRAMRKRFETADDNIEQIGLVLGLMLDSVVIVVCVPLVLMQWGFEWEEIRLWMLSALTGFRVGNVEISLSTLLTGIFVFAVSLLVSRILTGWLRDRFISRTRLDEGLKNSISTGIGYVGFLISAALGITYAGLDLTNLALIAGALSVGIGFGLQNIVNNFVSGLIILVERPVKVGDWIGVGEYSGFVKRISVRATELETLDRQSVVVPNAELINTAVTNWMLKDKLGRISVKVGVSYASDERQVRDLLLEVARHHDQVVSEPAPDVIFTGFGDNSLDFELRVFLKDVGRVVPVSSDLRFAIRHALREAGIEIPFPQRDIHIKPTATFDAFLEHLGKRGAE